MYVDAEFTSSSSRVGTGGGVCCGVFGSDFLEYNDPVSRDEHSLVGCERLALFEQRASSPPLASIGFDVILMLISEPG